RRQMRAVDEVIVELHDVPELRPHGGERGFEILEGLHRLAPKVADDLVVAVDPQLTGDVDDACRRGDLDDVGIAGGPAQRRRIDERVWPMALPSLCVLDHAAASGESPST